MSVQKLTVIDPVSGFTERESNSKAILNTDIDSLLKYKIQKRRFSEINKNSNEILTVRQEIDEIKSDLSEIKRLLLQIKEK